MTHNPEQLQAKFDLGIALTLSSWDALSLAVQNEWGGSDSADKRDWFAGAVSDLFQQNPETDAGDLEEFLAQVMEDEFEVTLEDDSEIMIAASIIKIKDDVAKGDFELVDKLWQSFKTKRAGPVAVPIGNKADDEDDEEEEGDSVDDESSESDTEMTDDANTASASRSTRRQEPEIDEDGFTKVVGRRR